MSLSADNNTEKGILFGTICGATLGQYALGKTVSVFMKTNDKDVSKIKSAVENILKETKLSQKGVYIDDLSEIKKTTCDKWPEKFVKGKCAAFAPFENSIGINMKKIPLAVFHEIGHAHNFNNRILNRIKILDPILTGVSIVAAAFPLFFNKTPDWEKENRNFAEKIKDGIYENAPIIAALAYAPSVYEEGIASIKASRFAKPALKPILYNKMIKGNILAFSTYVLGLISTTTAAIFAQKVNE